MFVSIRFVIDHLANEGNGDEIGSLVLTDGRSVNLVLGAGMVSFAQNTDA